MTHQRFITRVSLFGFMLIVLILNSSDSAFALRYRATDWKDTDTSMTELLNSGWKIINHGSNRGTVSDQFGNKRFDEETYTFILNKEDKYILCYMINPRTPQAEFAACRSLN
jgi:heptaprenylglyceryl phosphate synthase